MFQSTEQLVNAKGRDGASAMDDGQVADDRVDCRLLLENWYQERGRNIENALLLARVHEFLSRALVERRFGHRDEAEARRILGLIKLIEDEHA